MIDIKRKRDTTGRKPGSDALFACIASHNIHDAYHLLYTNEAEIDGQDFNGQTALHHAVNRNNIDMIHTLLEKNADPCI